MLLLVVVQVILAIVLIWGVITQLILPGINGTKLFPAFLKEQKLREEIVEIKQASREQSLEEEIVKLKEKVDGSK